MAFYLDKYIPMNRQKLGGALKGVAVELGIGGAAPGSPAPHLALGHLLFESLQAFQTSFAPHAQEIMADIPNYTNTQRTIQISELKM
jgi:uncharacterized protein (TIGR02118 family)